jgi:hypothetical protein
MASGRSMCPQALGDVLEQQDCADHRPGRPATQNEAHLSSSWVISARQGGHSPPRVSMAIAGERGHRDQRFW